MRWGSSYSKVRCNPSFIASFDVLTHPSADIIYHLFDAFTAYNAEITEAKRKDAAPSAVWPCRLKTIAAFAKRDPIILGVDILDGTLRVGTPLAVVRVDKETGHKEVIHLGKITSLEINHKTFDVRLCPYAH